MADYAKHLFSYVPPDRLEMFSYGHVIPPENLMALTILNGVGGQDFDFTYDARESEKMVSLHLPHYFHHFALPTHQL